VLSDEAESQAAVTELTGLGYDETVLFQGEEFAENVDPNGEHSGVLGKIGAALAHHLSEQPNYLAQYQEEARAGKRVLATHVKDHEQALAVKEVMERYHATNVRFFGRFAVADLTPESNPSKPSDASPEVASGAQRQDHPGERSAA
jgi:hypothetical protein